MAFLRLNSFTLLFNLLGILLFPPIHLTHTLHLPLDLPAQLRRLNHLGMDTVGEYPRYQLHLTRRLEFDEHPPFGIAADLLPRHPDPVLDRVGYFGGKTDLDLHRSVAHQSEGAAEMSLRLIAVRDLETLAGDLDSPDPLQGEQAHAGTVVGIPEQI